MISLHYMNHERFYCNQYQKATKHWRVFSGANKLGEASPE